MSTTPLHELTAVEAAQRIARNDLSPVDYLEALLARIAVVDKKVLGFTNVDAEGARAMAKTLDAEARSGKFRGPLHGVPFAVKEEFHVAGMPDRSEPRGPEGPAPNDDAVPIAKLKAAGAILLGKTSMVGRSGPPATRNPWNLDHTPGGTSSGSGAVVGARMVPFALGEQTYGSNNRPAGWNGGVGLKPTFGRISRRGMDPFTYTHDHPGLIGLTMADLAVILGIVSGHDPQDPTSLQEAPTPGALDQSKIVPPVIGVVRNFFPDMTEPVMQAAIDASVSVLSKAGAKVKDVRLPSEFALTWPCHRLISEVESTSLGAVRNAREMPKGYPETYDFRAGSRNMLGELVPATFYLQALRLRGVVQRRTARAFDEESVDAFLMAIAPSGAPKGLDSTGDTRLLACWSHLGFPSIALQSGKLTPDNLPLPLQFVGRPRGDYRLLHVGAWCEGVLGRLRPPDI